MGYFMHNQVEHSKMIRFANSVRLFAFFFRRVRKIVKSNNQLRHVCLYVRLFVRRGQLGSQRTGLYQILYLSIFRKSVQKSFIKIRQE